MSTSERLGWLADVSAEDLSLVGLSPPDDGQPASVALLDWAREYVVDLGHVHDCLQYLQSGPHVLLAPSPLALMAYSPRRGTFRASFDLEFPEELADARFARAGAWLTVLASEVGALPTAPGHWLVATVGPSGLDGPNVGLLTWVQIYASSVRRHGVERLSELPLTDYNQQMSQAVWRCAAYALR